MPPLLPPGVTTTTGPDAQSATCAEFRRMVQVGHVFALPFTFIFSRVQNCLLNCTQYVAVVQENNNRCPQVWTIFLKNGKLIRKRKSVLSDGSRASRRNFCEEFLLAFALCAIQTIDLETSPKRFGRILNLQLNFLAAFTHGSVSCSPKRTKWFISPTQTVRCDIAMVVVI